MNRRVVALGAGLIVLVLVGLVLWQSVVTPAQPQPPGKPPDPSFQDLIKIASLVSYKVNYRVSTIFREGQTVSDEQIWYFKPPKARYDFTILVGPQQAGSVSVFVLEEGVYICTSGVLVVCLTMPKDLALGLNLGAQLQEKFQRNPEQFDATYKETRQIAGQQAQCFVLKAEQGLPVGFTEVSEVSSCYSTQGIPLLSQIKGLVIDVTMEATSFSTSVTDADFRLPAQPMAMP